jgi:DNA polymerase III delta prime subunit
MNDNLLVEKYRPTKLDNVVGNEEIIKSCKKFVEKGRIPHLIFSGPAGVGKTTIAEILGKKIAGVGNTKMLNASDERGVAVAKGPIKNWAQTDGRFMDRIKIVILDEADHSTPDFQAAIRKIMEDESAYCRFIWICNKSHKIIDPIKSRCVEFKFKGINKKIVLKRLAYICKKEEIDLTPQQLARIINVYQGDMRKGINIIDSVKNGAEFEAVISKINPKMYLKLVLQNDLKGIRNYIDNNIFSNDDMKYLISRCINILMATNGAIEKNKSRLLLLNLTEADYRLAMGTNYYSIAIWLPLSVHCLLD